MSDTKSKLSCVTVALHWIVGISMIMLVTVGVYMTDYEVYALYPIHKSVGMIIFVCHHGTCDLARKTRLARSSQQL
jgi:Cytochrome B561